MKSELNVFTYDYLSWKCPACWWINIKQFFRNIKWAWQRATKGYCDRDVWNLDSHLLILLRDTIKQLAETTHSYPGDEEFNTPEKWEEYLLTISRLFDHSIDKEFDDGAYYKNPFEEEFVHRIIEGQPYWKAYSEDDGSVTYELIKDDAADKQLVESYLDEMKHIDQLRKHDRTQAFEMLNHRFEDLWD